MAETIEVLDDNEVRVTGDKPSVKVYQKERLQRRLEWLNKRIQENLNEKGWTENILSKFP